MSFPESENPVPNPVSEDEKKPSENNNVIPENDQDDNGSDGFNDPTGEDLDPVNLRSETDESESVNPDLKIDADKPEPGGDIVSEDTVPPISNRDTIEDEVAGTEDVIKPESSEKPKEVLNFTSLSKAELVVKLEDLLGSGPVHEIRREVEAIKINFYKKHRAENEIKRKKFIEEGGISEDFTPPDDPEELKISELLKKYRNQRLEYNKVQDDAKGDNLRMKQEIIEEIKELITSEESINKTFQEFRELQNRWREIGAVPQQNLNDLWETYHHHVEKFYDYIKINKELRDLDLKKNMEGKIQLCEKAEQLLLEPNVVNAFATLQKYHEQWREIGPVPKEKRQDVWERFKEATSKINRKHQQYYQDIKENQKKNLDSKLLLSEKAEQIASEPLDNHKEWVRKTNEILELQKVWKTIGFAPKKDNNKIYSRFRAACDKFFEQKRHFYAQNLDEQNSNLQLKIELCIQAEALQDSTDWKKVTDEYIRLQRKWKDIGPAPRKNSEQVWKRFRTACDKFFARKSEYFSTIDNTFEKNLEAKELLIKEIESFTKTGSESEDLAKIQAFQRQWTEIGFVPLEKKDELQKRYREAINSKLDGLEVDEFRKNLLKFKNRIEGIMQKPNAAAKIRFEREKYMAKLQQLKTDIGVWENNIGFFANTSNAESMLKDFEVKIREARVTIHLLEEKITIIDELNLD